MSDKKQPEFFRGPRMAVYLAVAVACGSVWAGAQLDTANTGLRWAETRALGLPVDRIDGETVVFVRAGPRD